MARIELLGGAVVEAADIEHQKRVAFLEIGRRRPVQRAVLVDDVKQHPAQHEHRMLAAIELQLVEAAELVAFLVRFCADEPQPRGRPRDRVVPRIGQCGSSASDRPSCRVMTEWSANTKRARGREKRAKISPVITARNDMPVKISTVATDARNWSADACRHSRPSPTSRWRNRRGERSIARRRWRSARGRANTESRTRR